ncbi:uncharacterized protein LOC117121737 [Anneissia japonica]|uniref:uncharacterized protein LOC117121737 n=1 Tax=Anneissia japonica TaxID=1529436 RepID=UPI001425A813|nr:uncharacterized protein LOC117121737 [Anneissia japonica]
MVEKIINSKRSEMRTLFNDDCFGYRPHGVSELAGDIIHVDCSIDRRYSNLHLSKFIRKNADKDIATLILTLSALESYGYKLLEKKGYRKKDWREINLESDHYQKKIAGTEGAEEILKMLGYVNKDKDRLSYSEYIKEPIREAIITILIDVIVAKEELDMYELECHPNPESIVCIIGTRNGQQEPSPRSTSDTLMTNSKIKSSQSFRIQPSKPPRELHSTFDTGMLYQTVDSWNIPSCNLCGDSKGIVNCKDCACSHCAECDKEWHLHPKRKNHKNRITSRESRGDKGECNRPMSAPGGNRVQRSVSLRPTVQSGSRLISRSHVNDFEVDTVSKLSNDRNCVESELRFKDKLLMSHKPGSQWYVKYEAERDTLKQQLIEIESRLRDGTVTEQPRVTASKMKHDDVTVNVMEVAVDHSLNLSNVTKNIRRPPTNDAVPYKERAYHLCEHQRNRVMCVYCHGDLNRDASSRGTELATQELHNYPEVRDKDQPLMMIESHFSNDTPAPVGWGCPYCTYVNKNIDIFICEMCSKTTLKEDRENKM